MNKQAFPRMGGRAARYAAAALGALVLASGAVAPATAQAVTATTLYVKQGGSDSAPCTSANPCATVSHALTLAASGATIKVFGTINDHLNITSPVTITHWPGGPAGSRAALNGTATPNLPVVTVNPGVASVTLNDLTIENGVQGIINDQGTVKLTDSTVSGNANKGEPYAGIWNTAAGTMTIVDSTIAKNSNAPGGNLGAGIRNNGTMTVIASTISGNTGGGIYSGQLATATLGATIVAGNTGSNCGSFAAGSLATAGYNLTNDKTGTACAFTAPTDRVNKNPLLGHLASNGGPTKTLLPAAGGPADDVIPKTTTLGGVPVCPGTDQRGVTRPHQSDTRCATGAVEV